ncbi:MAG: TIGR01459 family HAD-type hydrolase [Pseudomonadota bacterium]
MTPILAALDDIADRYDALFCDLWGCLHDGVRAFPDAVAALRRFRAKGGYVMLVTNSPRPRDAVIPQLAEMAVPRDCWDGVTSSGDAAQAALVSGAFGERVYHLGPERDLPFFTEMAEDIPRRVTVTRVPLAEAESIVCTGLFDDENETPDDYRLTIATGVNRGLKLLCANPDIVVDRGETRLWCAGALAAAYTEAGGESHYFGKPHAPIYALSRARMVTAGRDVEDARILALGDGIATDVAGGMGEGLDTLFITGGLAAAETGMRGGNPDPEKLAAYLAAHRLSPTAAIGFLR